jgi:hypothetical protein
MSDAPLTSREKVFGLVFALVATALLVEIGFRAFGPDYHAFNNMFAEYPSNPRGYFAELRKEDGEPIYGVPMDERVSLGGRTGEASNGQAPTRILGLGDSQAQGQGVYFRDTMYEKLSGLLAQQGVPTRVRNASVSGYDLDEIAARYAYEARDSGAYDVVLYAMVLDDFGLDRSNIEGLDFIQFQPGYSFDPWRARSATWNFFSHIAEQWDLSEKTTAAYLQSFRGENLKARTQHLKRFAEQVSADGAELVVIVLPLLYDFQHYPFTEVHEAMTALGTENGIHVLDMLPHLQHYAASELWVHAIDHHPNEVAHARVAQEVDAYLQQSKLLTSKRNP